MSLTSHLANYSFLKSDKARDKGLVTPSDIIRFDNLSYGINKKWNLLDIYAPKERVGTLPVIISVHGGAWVYGTKDIYQHYCMSLAKKGFAVINFNYRLAPHNKFPAQLEDINELIKWMYDHATTYHLDTSLTFMIGDSAGAHLLALYCCLLTNPQYASKFNFTLKDDFCPKAIALNCGVYDVTRVNDQNANFFNKVTRDFLGKQNYEEGIQLTNALNYITKDFPPVHLMTSNGDMLANQAPLMKEKLNENNISYEFKIYGDDNNKLMHVFHLDIRNNDARSCNDEQCNFFKKYIKD